MSRRSVFVAAAALALVSWYAPASAQQSPPAAGNAAAQLPGGTYDSIKKLPDWSGMWTPGRPPADAPPEDKQMYARGIFGEGIPLAPKYAQARDARLKAVTGQLGVDKIPLSNSGLCIPTGEPQVMGEVSHEYLFSPGRVTISLENGEIRRIWTDGRGHPSEDESNPSFSGHSIGHWEGDTLVVDTIQIFPDAEIYMGGHVTPKTHIVERFTRVGDKMRVRTVITDPDLLATPWAFTRWYDRDDARAGRLRALHARRPREEGRRTVARYRLESQSRHFWRSKVKAALSVAAGATAALAVGAACCLGVAPASAHHSFAMFDISKRVTIQGTVEKFEWSNPHSWLFVAVPGAKGATSYGFEMQSVGELLRRGWKKVSFKPGDEVKIGYHPLLDGTPGGQLTTAWTPDGKLIGGGPPPGFGPGQDRRRASGPPGGPPPADRLAEIPLRAKPGKGLFGWRPGAASQPLADGGRAFRHAPGGPHADVKWPTPLTPVVGWKTSRPSAVRRGFVE